MADPIRVTVHDPESGETVTKEVQQGDYLLICHEPCHRHHVQTYPTAGTHVVTIRGVQRRA